jgi:hypothetical protein
MGKSFYSRVRLSRGDDEKLADCVDTVVAELEAKSTTCERPGMLLGKIQSGKTRAFIGIVARAFDRNFDVAIVLTKGTKTLSTQTVARISADFREFIDGDEILVLDIMNLPGRLTRGELQRKIVLVAKKQKANLARVLALFQSTYPDLKSRRVLLIDDEADLASVRFVRQRGTSTIQQGTIAAQMDALRGLAQRVAFLQVTATPYSLYLQPQDYEADDQSGYVFKPKRPSFTELLPIHSNYVGGDDYFGSFDQSDPRAHLFVEVAEDEQNALRRHDKRRIRSDNVLDTPNVAGLRCAILTFVLAVCVRRWQQEHAGERQKKYAMVIHNDTQRSAHAWQEQVIDWIFEAIDAAAHSTPAALMLLFNPAFDGLSHSVAADGGVMPARDIAFTLLIEALQRQDVVREKVNSDKNVLALLDEKGELKLRTAYNIYLGGNILDRGITIPNLIAFYYGRNPKTMQADTVLQHSRMYGTRDRRDLAVTRFYTSRNVYDRLFKINSFETALREAFERGAHDQGVVFIQSDSAQRVKPCAPNKVLLSDVVAIRPSSCFLPTGFKMRPAGATKGIMTRLESLIDPSIRNTEEFVEVEYDAALEIISLIEKTMAFEDEPFEWDAFRGLLGYYSKVGPDRNVLLMALTGRRIDRERSGDKSGLSIIGAGPARAKITDSARSRPAIVLVQQVGSVELNWSGYPFWWPILAAPGTVEPCVFATKVASE